MSRISTATNAILLLLLGGALAYGVRAQPPMAAPPLTWPPAPADIVNLRADALALSNSGGARIYTVPGDRWLVLTDLVAAGTEMVGTTPQFGVPAVISLGVGSTKTVKVTSGIQSPYHSSGAVGFTFPPGSNVLIDLDGSFGQGTAKSVDFSIQGYLATQP